MLGAIKAGLTVVAKGLGVARWFQERATKKEQEQVGRTEAERDQLKDAHDARKRMDAVDEPTSQSTRDKLRKGDF